MTIISTPPYPSYFDASGAPLTGGYLYFGAANQNPETNPITVYWDAAYTQPAAQPIRTSGGFAVRNGSPASVYVNTNYSVTVRDKNKNIVYSKLLSEWNTDPSINAVSVIYNPPGFGAVSTNVASALNKFVHAGSFGAVGDGVTDDSLAIQAAVTYACTLGKTLLLDGNYAISQSITFPNKPFSIIGNSATGTAITQIGTSTTLKLFDLSGVNGPGHLISNLSFNGPSGSYGGIGIYIYNNNGLQINNCWFRGLTTGVKKALNAGDAQILNSTFEFNNTAIDFTGANECIINNNTFYWNVTDVSLSGACTSFNYSNSNHIATNTNIFYLNGCTDATIYNVSIGPAPGITWAPVAVNMLNGCQRNVINGVSATDFCAGLINMASASNCQNNSISNIRMNLTGASVPSGTGAYGIQAGASCQNNSFSNYYLSSLDYGVVDAAGANFYLNGKINTCSTAGVLLQGADNCEFDILQMSGNAADWVTSGSVPTVWLNQCTSSLAGLTPTRYGQRWSGIFGRVFYGTAAPLTLTYLKGDRVINVNPAVGSPKAWVCTVAGTPGTWVSEGNL